MVVGGIVAAVALGTISQSRYGALNFAVFMPAIGAVAGGLVLVMSGQVTRATVDTADNTGRMLHLLQRSQR